MRARRAAGEYPPGFERELDRLFDRFAPPEVSNDFDAALERAEDLVIVDPVIPVASNSPVLGVVKRVMSKLLGWYHVWLAQQISGARHRDQHRAAPARRARRSSSSTSPATSPGRAASARGSPPCATTRVWEAAVTTALHGCAGRVALVECGDGALLAALVARRPRRVRRRAARRGRRRRARRAGSRSASTTAPRTSTRSAPAALGGLVLRGLVERAPLGELLLLVDAAAAKLAPGGRLVVCSLRARGVGPRRAPRPRPTSSPGHPLHPDTWNAVLPEQGFADVQVHAAGADAYVVTATRADE